MNFCSHLLIGLLLNCCFSIIPAAAQEPAPQPAGNNPENISRSVDESPQRPRRDGGNRADGSQRMSDERRGSGRSGGDRAAGGRTGGSGLGNYTTPPPANNVPEHPWNIILGRPTGRSITIRVLFHNEATARVIYGTSAEQLSQQTTAATFKPKDTSDFILEPLQPNTRYYYRLIYQLGAGAEESTDIFTFHTQRNSGETFVFTVTSDSHLDENTSGDVYLRTLANALYDNPDFHFELGDTFMTGKYVKPEYSEPQYLAQRYYLGSLCHSAPLFFALGNHDGESGSRGSKTWAAQTRTRLFPNPEPNAFYTGNDQREPEIGLPQNYYQWKWGDAQFIVLDPFRYTTQRSRDGSGWAWTLGEQQYHWLKSSLENVSASYRFVFLHHLVGGSPSNSRGGVEVSHLWEWGGKSLDGESQFAKYRPGWELPIHDLLVKHGVSIVFHGHDHLFVKQDRDGIVYQEVPQPGHPRSGNTNTAKEYGYLSGEVQSSSGFIRIRVGPKECRADYVRTFLPAAESAAGKNGDVSYSYVVEKIGPK